MILKRQKRLLSLVEALGGSLNNLDFQKLLFLYCQESEEIPPYEFIPYRYGGFSFTSYADKRHLVERSGALYAVQSQLELEVHAGGKTVLELKGYGHYVPEETRTLFLYAQPKGGDVGSETTYNENSWHSARRGMRQVASEPTSASRNGWPESPE